LVCAQLMTALTAAAIEPHLRTRWMGRVLHIFPELDSTNITARDMAAAGAADGTAVIAEAQRRGRGRLGRSWASPAGKNLYLSVLVRGDVPLEHVAQLSLLSGVAACETVRQWCRAEIKWPNDVLIDGRKVVGILAELHGSGAERTVVLGIGVNLNATLDDFPEELRDKAGSVSLATGAAVDRAHFAGRLLNALETRYEQWSREGFAPIAAAWRSLTPLIGREIRVQEPGALVEGTVIDIDDEGALRLRLADGAEHRVLAGDVTVVGGYARG
jgi:BirA family biotin operon repressor/biotin-[acetyl-CoA-carboxylase] ligase